MLMIGLLLLGCALPLAMPSPRALGVCAALGVVIFAMAGLGEAELQGSLIAMVGVTAGGMLIGAVLRALSFGNLMAEDRAIRRELPRELPQRYR